MHLLPKKGQFYFVGQLLPDGDLDDGLQVDRDPCLFADLADDDFYLSEGCLDRGRAVLSCDGGRSASDETASVDHYLLTATDATIASANNHS